VEKIVLVRLNYIHPRNPSNSVPVEAERLVLALGWLQPGELSDTGYRLGLQGNDFSWVGHGFLFEYIVDCGERGVTPTVNECVGLAADRCVEVDAAFLFDLLLNADFRDGELVNYAFDVQRASQDRASEFFRELCRDTIRAINRGLRIDAENHRLRRGKSTKVGGGPNHRQAGQKVVCRG